MGTAGPRAGVVVGSLLALVLAACVEADMGALDAAWAITVAGEPATCADVGAETVEVLAIGNDGSRYSSKFDCEAGAGTTSYLPSATYVIEIRLLAPGDTVLGSSGEFSQAVPSGRIEPLPVVTFAVTD